MPFLSPKTVPKPYKVLECWLVPNTAFWTPKEPVWKVCFCYAKRFTPRQLSKDNRPIVLLLFLTFLHAKDIWRNIHVFQRGPRDDRQKSKQHQTNTLLDMIDREANIKFAVKKDVHWKVLTIGFTHNYELAANSLFAAMIKGSPLQEQKSYCEFIISCSFLNSTCCLHLQTFSLAITRRPNHACFSTW